MVAEFRPPSNIKNLYFWILIQKLYINSIKKNGCKVGRVSATIISFRNIFLLLSKKNA